MTILQKIKEQKGYSVEDISRITGIPIPTVYAHLNGNRGIGYKSAPRYIRNLGITFEELYPDLEQEIEHE